MAVAICATQLTFSTADATTASLANGFTGTLTGGANCAGETPTVTLIFDGTTTDCTVTPSTFVTGEASTVTCPVNAAAGTYQLQVVNSDNSVFVAQFAVTQSAAASGQARRQRERRERRRARVEREARNGLLRRVISLNEQD